jgi:organic radical activating enzyme
MARRLSLAEVEESRWVNGDSALLFITDRCPVGCKHCSVDSRPDSPKITDFALFSRIVAGLARSPFRIVGISGGEPFVERRGLSQAVRELDRAGKGVVVYTSGFWARSPKPPAWIESVIDQCGAVFLSTDAFHQAGLGEERFCNAARAIADRGTALVVQVLDLDAEVERAQRLLASALGPDWAGTAEVNQVPLLPYGRAGEIYAVSRRRPIESFGPCRVARARVVRYDGVVTACCNEAVLMGAGPDWFRRTARTTGELLDVIDRFQEDGLLNVIGREGVGRLAGHPLAGDLASREAAGICGACWALVGRISRGPSAPGEPAPAGPAAHSLEAV